MWTPLEYIPFQLALPPEPARTQMSLISPGVWMRKWRLRFKLRPWLRGRGSESLGSSVRNSVELTICPSGPGPQMLL